MFYIDWQMLKALGYKFHSRSFQKQFQPSSTCLNTIAFEDQIQQAKNYLVFEVTYFFLP